MTRKVTSQTPRSPIPKRRRGPTAGRRAAPAPIALCEAVSELLAPGAGRKIALLKEWSQRLEMRRYDRLARARGYQREQGCDDQQVGVARGANKGLEFLRQCRDGGIGLPGAAISAIGMQEVVLQVAENERGRFHPAGSTIRLPSVSIRPARPGSMTVVASGCSRMAGPRMFAPA